jgi:hypothetical protein
MSHSIEMKSIHFSSSEGQKMPGDRYRPGAFAKLHFLESSICGRQKKWNRFVAAWEDSPDRHVIWNVGVPTD